MLGYFSKVGGPHTGVLLKGRGATCWGTSQRHAGVLLKGRGPHAGVLLKCRGATCWGTSQR